MSADFAFLDSGTGGVPYLEYLQNAFPQLSCVYYADEENFPYGTKTSEEIIECARNSVKKVISIYNPKVIVLACNTMTVTALETLRKEFNVPFVGTVPAIKLASKVSKNGCIGLLATEKTVSHEYTKKLIDDFARDCKVLFRADTKLIDFIEKNIQCVFHEGKLVEVKNNATEEEIEVAIKPAIEYFLSKGVDTIILGCTHFVHFATEFTKLVGERAVIVDSRDGVVRQSLKILESNK